MIVISPTICPSTHHNTPACVTALISTHIKLPLFPHRMRLINTK